MNSAFERAKRIHVDPLPGHDGALLAKLVVFAQELQKDAGDQPFKMPVRFCMAFLGLPDTELSHAGGLLRQLERRQFLKSVQRGTASRDGIPGQPSLYRFIPLDQRL